MSPLRRLKQTDGWRSWLRDMAISEIGGAWRLLWQPGMFRRSLGRVGIQPAPHTNTPLFVIPIRFTTTRSVRSSLVPRARDENSRTSFTSQEEDLAYVAKLVAGSFVGAAAIKYGSALFPEITTPNIVLAFIIIVVPLLVAVLLLAKESR